MCSTEPVKTVAPIDDRERSWYLQHVALCQGLAPEQVDEMMTILDRQQYCASERIIDAAHAEPRVAIVRSGTVRLFHRGPEARELTVDLAGPGRLFGVTSLFGTAFGAAPDGLLAEAVTDVEVHSAEGQAFLDHLSRSPQLMANFIVQMAAHILQTEQHLDRLVSVNARGRLAATLHRLALEGGEADHHGGRRLPGPVTHETLGRQIGCSRETVTRLLASLEAEGHIRRCGRRITLPDPERLVRRFGLDESPIGDATASPVARRRAGGYYA